MPPSSRPSIFISYAKQDKAYLDHVKRFLQHVKVEVWEDTKIAAGARWRVEINAALNRASAAILLVSQHFLNSAFINNTELPSLLEAIETRKCQIWVVVVDFCRFTETPLLSEFQTVNDPEDPLAGKEPTEVNRLLRNLSLEIDAWIRERSDVLLQEAVLPTAIVENERTRSEWGERPLIERDDETPDASSSSPLASEGETLSEALLTPLVSEGDYFEDADAVDDPVNIPSTSNDELHSETRSASSALLSPNSLGDATSAVGEVSDDRSAQDNALPVGAENRVNPQKWDLGQLGRERTAETPRSVGVLNERQRTGEGEFSSDASSMYWLNILELMVWYLSHFGIDLSFTGWIQSPFSYT
ncbi:MAG TPA: toll/interleukin-1 receptor domain-containing protein, partial [Longimicrobium sp.]